VTVREALFASVSARRTLAAFLLILVIGSATEFPALGATQSVSPIDTNGLRTANARSCSETKVLKSGGTELHFPSCWTMANYMEGSSFTNVIAFLSNQPMHKPCVTTHSGTSTTVRCGFPIKTLKRGGVLVMFINGGMPGWTITKVTGQRLVVDHHAARETVVPKPYRSLHATDEVWIYIDRGIPDNYYEFEVFFRNPGVSEDQALLRRMLDSMRIQ
jgi:hypothetical protein